MLLLVLAVLYGDVDVTVGSAVGAAGCDVVAVAAAVGGCDVGEGVGVGGVVVGVCVGVAAVVVAEYCVVVIDRVVCGGVVCVGVCARGVVVIVDSGGDVDICVDVAGACLLCMSVSLLLYVVTLSSSVWFVVRLLFFVNMGGSCVVDVIVVCVGVADVVGYGVDECGIGGVHVVVIVVVSVVIGYPVIAGVAGFAGGIVIRG